MTRWGLVAALLAIVGCSGFGGNEDHLVEGVDFDVVFAPPSAEELAAVERDWDRRVVAASNPRTLESDVLRVGSWNARVSVISHEVGDVEHVGAVVIPEADYARKRPVLVYLHGGDSGVSIDRDIGAVMAAAAQIRDTFIVVIPSFRSESIRFNGKTHVSDGPPSPWNYDVDDALSLLEVVLADVPQADESRIVAVGFSRGATVAMLMAIRDRRIDGVVEYFGATDFYSSFAQEVIGEALRGRLRALPGLSYLNETYIQPLKAGDLTSDDVRPELTRRSPVYFADRLPALQIHHGDADDVVPVSEAEALIEVMGPGDVESYLYPGGSHHPLTLNGSIGRTAEFLLRVIASEVNPSA